MIVRHWCVLFASLLVCELCCVDGKRKGKRTNNDTRIFIYVSSGIFVFLLVLCCTYVCKRLFPRGIQFNAIELDEIKIERLDDIEAGIQNNIKVLKDKLTFHRKKKTAVQTERDIKIRVNERAELFNARGRTKYGDAWDAGTVPTSDIFAMTQEEMKTMKHEIKTITKERKKEEQRELRALWEDIKVDDREHKADEPLLPKTSNTNSTAKESKERDMWALWNEVRDDGNPKQTKNQFADERSDSSVYNNSSTTETKSKFTHKSSGLQVQELQPLIGNQHSSMNARDEAAAAAYRIIGKATKAPPHIKPPPKKEGSGPVRNIHGVHGEGGSYSLDLSMPDYGMNPHTAGASGGGGGSSKRVILPPIDRGSLKEVGKKPLERPGTTPDKDKSKDAPPAAPQRTFNRPAPPPGSVEGGGGSGGGSSSIVSGGSDPPPNRSLAINQALSHSLMRPPPPRGPPPGKTKKTAAVTTSGIGPNMSSTKEE